MNLATAGVHASIDWDNIMSEKDYGSMKAHAVTIAANDLMVKELSTRFPNIDTFGLNPGMVTTDIRKPVLPKGVFAVLETFVSWLGRSSETYGLTLVQIAASPDLEGKSGALFNPKGEAIQFSPFAQQPGVSSKMWEISKKLAKLE